MHGHEEAGIAVQYVLLDQDLLVAEVLEDEAAVLLVGPHAQVTGFARLQEGLAIHDAGFAPAFAVRSDFGLEELAGRIAEQLHLGVQGFALHG